MAKQNLITCLCLWIVLAFTAACGDGPSSDKYTGSTDDSAPDSSSDAGAETDDATVSDDAATGPDGSTGGPANAEPQPFCGDGNVDPGEFCDGDCPTSCPAPATCQRARIEGSAEQCSARCETEPIESCVDGDGCCPTGCTGFDDDCAPDCLTCADVGATCGQHSDGCGGTLNCGGCPIGETCSSGSCEPESHDSALGMSCQTASTCQVELGQDADCVEIEFDEKFCALPCDTDGDCPADAECAGITSPILPGPEEFFFCRLKCDRDSECQNGMLCDDLYFARPYCSHGGVI